MQWIRRLLILSIGCTAAPWLAAQTKLDISMPWGPTEFHTVNAQNFAKRVAEVTKGQVLMTVHPGGASGSKANETVRAKVDGVGVITIPLRKRHVAAAPH